MENEQDLRQAVKSSLPFSTGTMDEDEVKNILLTLVEPNKSDPLSNDRIGTEVIGWRFTSTSSSEDDPPVCEWTGIECDPIDGSVTVLDLGHGLWVKLLLGEEVPPSEDGVDNGHSDRLLLEDDKIVFKVRQRQLASQEVDATTATTIDPSQIAPSLPSALGKLLSLRLLNLSSNQIQGTIPKTISQLPNLEIIDISSNDLVGSFPYFESEVLRVLDISKNRFHGKLPKELFAHPDIGKETAPYLASLVKFDISHNGTCMLFFVAYRLSINDKDCCYNKLTHLHLLKLGFNGTIPLDGRSATYDSEKKMDTTMQNLQYFDIGFNLFSGTICNNIGNFKELQALYMEHNRLIGTIPKALYRGSGVGANPLPLVQLFLQQNDLSGTLPSVRDRANNVALLIVCTHILTLHSQHRD